MSGVARRLELEDGPEDYQAYEQDGRWFLATRVNGDCVYLVNGSCSIYERRPRSCRRFDCADVVLVVPFPLIPIELKRAIAMRLTR